MRGYIVDIDPDDFNFTIEYWNLSSKDVGVCAYLQGFLFSLRTSVRTSESGHILGVI